MSLEEGMEFFNSIDFTAVTKVGLTLAAKTGVTTTVSELVKALMNKCFKPKISTHNDYKEDYDVLEDYISEYLITNYQKNIIMNTIVFRGQQKMLSDLYIPLTIVKSGSVNVEDIEKYIIAEDCFEFIEMYDKVLIVDTAGMGKSTIVKYMAIQAIKNNQYIPITIELRKLSTDTDIGDYLVQQLELIDKKLVKSDVNKMLKRGDFIIFFDGYDEITEDNKQKVTDRLQDFIFKAGSNKYVLTSREESDLNCFGDFQRFSISPLIMEEAFELICKYDNDGDLSKKLIDRIKNDGQLEMLKEFLINPMLVSLLYKTFEYKEEITYKKLGFYVQVYEALFNDHDKTKGGAYVHPKKSLLDSYEFERILRGIAFISLQNNRIEFNKSELLVIIEKAIRKSPWNKVTGSHFLDDIIHAVPLFQNDGTYFKWVHKSFMEYFAAGYICFEYKNTSDLISEMMYSKNNKRYINVLDFCYDMKPDVARHVIIYNFISEFIKSYDSIYNNSYYKRFDKDLLKLRKSLCFTNEYAFAHFKNNKNLNKSFDNINDFIHNVFSGNYIKNVECVARNEILPKELIIIGETNYKVIERLLSNKGVDIFKSADKSIREELKKTKYPLDKLKENVYIINEDTENIINTENSFEYLTKFLQDYNNKYIDYDKAVFLKELIETEIEELKDDDIFLL